MEARTGPDHRFVVTQWEKPEIIRFADTWTQLISELKKENINFIWKVEVMDKRTKKRSATSRRKSS